MRRFQNNRRTSVLGMVAVAALVLMTGCGGGSSKTNAASTGDGAASSDTRSSSPTQSSSQDASASGSSDRTEGCGVTLADVQATLPRDTPVAPHDTPDPNRCNFTWSDKDGGHWGIDVVLARGGRAALEGSEFAPADGGTLRNGAPYESVAGLGDRAWAVRDAAVNASVVALRGSDGVVVGIVFEDFARNVDFTTGPLTPLGVDSLDVCKALATVALGA